jgi:hypothetical protein
MSEAEAAAETLVAEGTRDDFKKFADLWVAYLTDVNAYVETLTGVRDDLVTAVERLLPYAGDSIFREEDEFDHEKDVDVVFARAALAKAKVNDG